MVDRSAVDLAGQVCAPSSHAVAWLAAALSNPHPIPGWITPNGARVRRRTLTGKGDGSSLVPGTSCQALLIAEGEQGRLEPWIVQ